MLLGVFTVPVAGVWRVSFTLKSYVGTGQRNWVWIYHNQQPLKEIELYTYSEDKVVRSTGGRELITRAEVGDTFYLGTGPSESTIHRILTCFEFLSL